MNPKTGVEHHRRNDRFAVQSYIRKLLSLTEDITEENSKEEMFEVLSKLRRDLEEDLRGCPPPPVWGAFFVARTPSGERASSRPPEDARLRGHPLPLGT